MKTYGGVDVQIYIFLTLAIIGGEWSAYAPATLPPRNIPQCSLDRSLCGPQSRSGR
jgi:hypothetical protein